MSIIRCTLIVDKDMTYPRQAFQFESGVCWRSVINCMCNLYRKKVHTYYISIAKVEVREA